MSTLGEELFNQLQDAEVLRSLTGQSEDVHFDCKAWPASDGDAQRTLAKAGCGLSDSEGGVVLIGMKAHAGRNREILESSAATPGFGIFRAT